VKNRRNLIYYSERYFAGRVRSVRGDFQDNMIGAGNFVAAVDRKCGLRFPYGKNRPLEIQQACCVMVLCGNGGRPAI
jgi:hypothetical protein